MNSNCKKSSSKSTAKTNAGLADRFSIETPQHSVASGDESLYSNLHHSWSSAPSLPDSCISSCRHCYGPLEESAISNCCSNCNSYVNYYKSKEFTFWFDDAPTADDFQSVAEYNGGSIARVFDTGTQSLSLGLT